VKKKEWWKTPRFANGERKIFVGFIKGGEGGAVTARLELFWWEVGWTETASKIREEK